MIENDSGFFPRTSQQNFRNVPHGSSGNFRVSAVGGETQGDIHAMKFNSNHEFFQKDLRNNSLNRSYDCDNRNFSSGFQGNSQ
jgi:hypothetical protein